MALLGLNTTVILGLAAAAASLGQANRESVDTNVSISAETTETLVPFTVEIPKEIEPAISPFFSCMLSASEEHIVGVNLLDERGAEQARMLATEECVRQRATAARDALKVLDRQRQSNPEDQRELVEQILISIEDFFLARSQV